MTCVYTGLASLDCGKHLRLQRYVADADGDNLMLLPIGNTQDRWELEALFPYVVRVRRDSSCVVNFTLFRRDTMKLSHHNKLVLVSTFAQSLLPVQAEKCSLSFGSDNQNSLTRWSNFRQVAVPPIVESFSPVLTDRIRTIAIFRTTERPVVTEPLHGPEPDCEDHPTFIEEKSVFLEEGVSMVSGTMKAIMGGVMDPVSGQLIHMLSNRVGECLPKVMQGCVVLL